MRKFFGSLYWRISFALLGLLALISLIQFTLVTLFWSRVTEQSEQQLYWEIAQELSTRFQPYLKEEGNFLKLQEIADEVKRMFPAVEIYILNSQGLIVANFSELLPKNYSEGIAVPLEPIKRFLSADSHAELPIYGKDPVFHESVCFSTAPVKIGVDDGYVYVVLRASRNNNVHRVLKENAAFKSIAIDAIVVSVGFALIGLGVFYVITRHFYKITSIVRKYAQGDFSERIPHGSEDEIGELAEAVNKMADRIEENVGQLQERDRLRRELLSNISHDLRAPVGVIEGYIDLLLNCPEKVSADERTQYLHILGTNTVSLRRLLTELFELSKLETKEMKPKWESFNIVEVAADLVMSFQELANKKQINIRLKHEERVPLVSADLGMIERALSNLIQNAVRYTDNGGAIEVGIENEGNRVMLSVTDTGVGISEEHLPHVFGRFYRVEEVASKKPDSTGLGLAIVKRIIELHGSEINVQSKENVGTRFSFCVPVSEEHL